MTLLQRAIEIYQTQGRRTLQQKGSRFLRTRASDAYWRLRGTRTVTRAEVTATFPTRNLTEARRIRRFLHLESPMLTDFLSSLHPDDVFYNVGAFSGLYSYFTVNVLPSKNVVAFEPNPQNLPKLYCNLAYNGLPRVQALALSDTTGRVEFNNPVKKPIKRSATGFIVPGTTEESLSVKSCRGDELIEQDELPPPTVVKIDVEGAEPLVIDGLRENLADKRCRLLYCEVHRESTGRRSVESYGSTPTALEQKVETLGFETERLAERSAEFFLKGTKETS